MRSRDIRDQSQKIVRKRSEFWTVFSPSQILGGRPSKSYTHFITPYPGTWKKFSEDTPTGLEVIGAHTLNFRPNFKFSRLNFFKGTPSQMWCALASLGQSVTRVKFWGDSTPERPKCSLPQNGRLSWSIWATTTFLFVDQSSFFFSHNVKEVIVDQILFRFPICWSVTEIFAFKFESCQKSHRILDVFFALPNFRGWALENLYPFYHLCLVAHCLEKVLWGYSH